MNVYVKELLYHRNRIWLIVSVLVLSFSVFLLEEKWVVLLGAEENLFEGLTCVFFLGSSLLYFSGNRRNFWLLALGLLFFFGAGEEISWGQRILGFEPPEAVKEINVQEEFTVHNLPLFNGTQYKGQHIGKKGLERLLEMNFLFRLFIMSFGILWPLMVYHLKPVSRLAQRLRMPVPPVSIGIFYAVSWLLFRFVLGQLPEGRVPKYYHTCAEIFEFLAAFVSLMIALYFFKNRNRDILGRDIKQTELLG